MKFTTMLLATMLLVGPVAEFAAGQTAVNRPTIEKALFRLALTEADRSLLSTEFTTIVKFGPEAIPVLLEIFSDESYGFGNPRSLAYPIRLLAGQALAKFKPVVTTHQEIAFASLRKLQAHRKPDVREIALATLYRLGDEAPLKLRLKQGYAQIQQRYTQIVLCDKQGMTILARRLRYDIAMDCHDLATCYLRILDKQRGKELLLRAIVFEPSAYASHYSLACAYASLGEIDNGLNALSQAVATGYADLSWLQRDQDLQGLHAHPRFAQIVQALAQRLSAASEDE